MSTRRSHAGLDDLHPQSGLKLIKFDPNTKLKFFLNYQKALQAYILAQTNGVLNDFLESDAYPNGGKQFPISMSTFSKDYEGMGFSDADLKEQYILYSKELHKMNASRQQLIENAKRNAYSIIYSHLKDSSKAAISRTDGFPELHRSANDPLMLWHIIVVSHAKDGDLDPILQENQAIEECAKLYQTKDEDLGSFLTRFQMVMRKASNFDRRIQYDAVSNYYTTTTMDDSLDAEEPAIKSHFVTSTKESKELCIPIFQPSHLGAIFISRLDKSTFADLQEDLRKKTGPFVNGYPATIDEGYAIATRFAIDKMTYGTDSVSSRRNSRTTTSSLSSSSANTSTTTLLVTSEAKSTSQPAKKVHKPCVYCKIANKGTLFHSWKECPIYAEVNDKASTAPTGKPMTKLTVALKSSTYSDLPNENGDCILRLDNCSSVSIIKDAHLCIGIMPVKEPFTVGGIARGSGGAVTITHCGYLPEIGPVFVAPSASSNILSQYELIAKGAHFSQRGFRSTLRVQTHTFEFDGEHDFTNKGIYPASLIPDVDILPDDSEVPPDSITECAGVTLAVNTVDEKCVSNDNALLSHSTVATVDGNAQHYTKREIKRAKLAVEIAAAYGYISYERLTYALNHGLMTNLPITAADVQRATILFGKDIPFQRGKTTRRTTAPFPDNIVPSKTTHQTLGVDLMFIEDHTFLVSISVSMGYRQVTFLKSKDYPLVKKALLQHISAYAKHGHKVVKVVCDPEATLVKSDLDLAALGIVLESSAPGQHESHVESCIRRIKETCRCGLHGLPYHLPMHLVPYLTYWAANRLNLQPNHQLELPISPSEVLTGIKPDYNRDLRLVFGAYCQVPVSSSVMDNTLKPRTVDTLALYPTTSARGSWKFYNLADGAIITAETWCCNPLPNSVIHQINQLDHYDHLYDSILPYSSPFLEPVSISPPSGSRSDEGSFLNKTDPEEADMDTGSSAYSESNQDSIEYKSTYNLRKRQPITYVISNLNMTIEQSMNANGTKADEAIKTELNNLESMNVFDPVDMETLSNEDRKKIIPSKMFLKEKLKQAIWKARLVAGGHRQKRWGDFDYSSPTVSMLALFAILALGANEQYHFTTMDVTAAYLNAEMTVRVLVKLPKDVSQRLMELYPEKYSGKAGADGCIVVILRKALYGCIESAKLWYLHASKKLIAKGFTKCPFDPCVFVRNKTIVSVYVDDFFICAPTQQELNQTTQEIKECFPKITLNEGDVQQYLGMNISIDRNSRLAHVSMTEYIDEITKSAEITSGGCRTPASSELFKIKDSSPSLDDAEKEWFHTHVAKLLYLSKRARPDIMTTVAFLTTRTNAPTKEDVSKLKRLIGYLRKTRDMGLTLQIGNTKAINVRAFCDASYAVHPCRKSHTGCALLIGNALIYATSRKQKILTKSSTEAEIVAVSDCMNVVLWLNKLLQWIGFDTPVVLCQDNTSAITIMKSQQPNMTMSKHVDIRRLAIGELINSGDIKVEYSKSADMIGDIFTKPLQGSLFYKHRASLGVKPYNDTVVDRVNEIATVQECEEGFEV